METPEADPEATGEDKVFTVLFIGFAVLAVVGIIALIWTGAGKPDEPATQTPRQICEKNWENNQRTAAPMTREIYIRNCLQNIEDMREILNK